VGLARARHAAEGEGEKGVWSQPAGHSASGAATARSWRAWSVWHVLTGGRGEVRGVWAGLGEREIGRAQRNRKIFLIYSNKFQTSLNYFEKMVDLPRSKNSK
jgi:hypothetical protein